MVGQAVPFSRFLVFGISHQALLLKIRRDLACPSTRARQRPAACCGKRQSANPFKEIAPRLPDARFLPSFLYGTRSRDQVPASPRRAAGPFIAGDGTILSRPPLPR